MPNCDDKQTYSLISEDLRSGLTASNQKLSVAANEAVLVARRWTAGEFGWLELVHAASGFVACFSIRWAVSIDGRAYVLIQEARGIDNEYECNSQFILEIESNDSLRTLNDARLQLIKNYFEESFTQRSVWSVQECLVYFGEMPPFGSEKYQYQKQQSRR